MAIKINGTNTTASPGITGPDTDTGLVYGTDEVQVVTGGTTRATVDSSGNLGIGTSSPSANLHVNGGSNSTQPHLRVTADRGLIARLGDTSGSAQSLFDLYDTDGSTQIVKFISGTGADFINTGGNFGIGTTSPVAGLTVAKQGTVLSGTSNSFGFSINPQSNGYVYLDAVTGGSNNTSLSLRTYNNGTYTQALQSISGNETTFETAGSERMRIDSSGNVGIGNTIPSSFDSAANNLVVGTGSGTNGITIYGGNTNDQGLYFADGTSGNQRYAGTIIYHHNIDSMLFGTNGGTERMRIDGSGRVFFNETSSDLGHKYIFSGNESADVAAFQYNNNTGTYFTVTTGAPNGNVELKADARSGSFPPLVFKTGANERMRILPTGGLTFNGDTAAANALDDYEEGTWTPTVTNGASAVTVDAGNCIYVKVGSLVTCHFEIYDITSPNNNPLDFGGLPYAPDNEGTFPLMSNSVDFPAGRTMLTGYLHPSKWRVYASGNNAGWLALTGNNMSTNGSFIGVISYRST
jgi:hypothetical protein